MQHQRKYQQQCKVQPQWKGRRAAAAVSASNRNWPQVEPTTQAIAKVVGERGHQEKVTEASCPRHAAAAAFRQNFIGPQKINVSQQGQKVPQQKSGRGDRKQQAGVVKDWSPAESG